MKTAMLKMPTAWGGAFGGKLLGLQMLRGIAAIMVVYAHLTERLVLRGFVSQSAWWLTPDIGQFGVCVFFAISGFVMIHSNSSKFGQAEYRDNVVKFVKHRISRIYPLYFLTTLLVVPFLYVTKHETVNIIDLLKSLLFIPYLNARDIYQPVYGLGWSLNYEMFFYGILAATLFLSLRAATLVIFGVIGALVAAGFVLGSEPQAYHSSQLLWFYTRPVMIYFVAGVLARAIPLHSLEARIARHNAMAIGLTLLAMYLAYRIRSLEWLSAMLIFVVVRAASGHVSYERLWRPARNGIEFIGDSSYSLYLTHSFVLGAVTLGIASTIHDSALAVLASLVGGIAAALILAALVYRYVEQPGVRVFKGWLSN